MSSEDDDLPKPPVHAFRAPIAYNSAVDAAPREIDYGSYRKLGLIKNTGQSYSNALNEARRKYGVRTDVLATARYWVAYVIQ